MYIGKRSKVIRPERNKKRLKKKISNSISYSALQTTDFCSQFRIRYKANMPLLLACLQLCLDEQQAYQTKSTKQLLPINQGHGSKTKARKGLFVMCNQQRLNGKSIALFLFIEGFLPCSNWFNCTTTAQRQINCSVLVYRRFPSLFCTVARLWYYNPDVKVPYSPFLRTMGLLGEEASHSNFLGK